MIYPSHLSIVEKLYQQFDGKSPASLYLKNYFRQNRSHGSRDRKIITEAFFALLRIGNAFIEKEFLFRHIAASILTSSKLWQSFFQQHCSEAFLLAQAEISKWKADDIFPSDEQIADSIDKEKFIQSHLHEHDTFIRVNHGCMLPVQAFLDEEKIPYSTCNIPNALRILRHTDLLNSALYKAGAFEVQDLMSQACMNQVEVCENETWLDACAGSGGKSLALLDRIKQLKLHNVTITVRDVRPAIIASARARFAKYRFQNVYFEIADARKSSGVANYDKIIVDAPCSGSGTWARSPEGLKGFTKAQLSEFVLLQSEILSNILKSLKKGGRAYYITCSVYELENGGILASLDTHLYAIESATYFKGYDARADTLFMAIIYKHK